MNLSLYSWILRLALPLVLLRLYWRSLRAPLYRRRVAERLALVDTPPADVWVHAVSVGEVQAAERLVRHLLERDPPLRVLVTTTTPTGAARLADLFGERVVHRYTPYDLPGIVGRFLARVRPRLLIVMETEIWPNTLDLCARRGIPAILANARLSARSARGYARLAGLTRRTFACFDRIAAQSESDAGRFVDLGADPARITVTGSVKFDLRQTPDLAGLTGSLRRLWGAERPVWVAASTHEGEERQVLEAHRQVLARLPRALLVLVPRHPERFERVAALVARQGFGLARRSRDQVCGPETQVFLGDSMGELAAMLAGADVAFIGGSLVPTGGHNLLEAAAVGVPVVVGPHTFNFAAISELMLNEGAAIRIADASGLAEAVTAWLADGAERARVGELGRTLVERNRGALDRLVRLVEGRLAAT